MTPRQVRFVQEYVKDCNGTQAAIRAGYSQNGAHVAGQRMLRNVAVKAAIAERQAVIAEKAELSAVRVLEELRRLAMADLLSCFDERGHLKPLKDIPADARAAIASVKVTKQNLTTGDGIVDDVIEIKLWNKNQALDTLAKHLGLLVEKVEHNGAIELVWRDTEAPAA
jgi:phage terminase small subunit